MKYFNLFLYSILLFSSSLFVQKASAQFHWDQPLNCSECHSCDKPTHQNPCLKIVPDFKRAVTTKKHSLAEAPKKVIIDVLTDKFYPTHFDHLAHAEMTQMGGGCESCHHHNPEGKIVACSQCHQPGPASTESNKPSLKAAMHQQCIGCHKTWDKSWKKETDCTSCHTPKAGTSVSGKKTMAGNKTTIPKTLLFHSDYEEGSLVTFHHGDHAGKYGLTCESCHQNQSCQSCHGSHEKGEVDHDNCASCHDTDSDENCQKCHSEKEKPAFNHSGKGFLLDETHKQFTCDVCHSDGNFERKPTCDNCHKGYRYPNQRPGKLVRIK